MATIKDPIIKGVTGGITTTASLIDAYKREMIFKVYKGCQDILEVPTEASDELRERILFINEKKKEMAKKCEEVWSQLFFTKLNRFTKEKVPMILVGPPGHGKTAAIMEAARQTAELLGMNYIERPTMNQAEGRPIEETIMDFPVVVEEPGSGTTALNFGGAPSKDLAKMADGSEREVMKKIIKSDFSYLSSCLGGVLILDDCLNAPAPVQSIFMGLAQFGCVNDLNIGKHSLVTFTGNLGAAVDGSVANRVSTPLQGRTKKYYVENTLEDWLLYMREKTCEDPLGMAGLDAFFSEKPPTSFAEAPDINGANGGDVPQYATPRNWTNAYPEIRDWIETLNGLAAKYGYGLSDDELQGNAENMSTYAKKVHEATEELHQALVGIVGQKHADSVREFYRGYRMGAFQIAANVLETGEFNRFDAELFARRYRDFEISALGKAFKKGRVDEHVPSSAIEEKMFSYAYVTSLADQAATRAMEGYMSSEDEYVDFSQQPEFCEIIKNFAIGMQPFCTGASMNKSILGFGIGKLISRINDIREHVHKLPPIGTGKKDDLISVSGADAIKDIEVLVKTMSENGIPAKESAAITSGISKIRQEPAFN